MGAAEYARLEKTLLARGLSQIELDRARCTATGFKGNIASALVARRVLTEAEVTTGLAETFRVPAWDGRVDEESARKLGEEFCWRNLVVPAERKGNRITVAVADPTNLELHSEVRFALGGRVVDVVVAIDSALSKVLRGLFPVRLNAEMIAGIRRYKPLPGPDREEPGPREWVAHGLIRAQARGEFSQVRVALGKQPQLEVRSDAGPWGPAGLIAQLAPSPDLLRAVAAQWALMAGLPSSSGSASGSMRVGISSTWHGGRQSALDVATQLTTAGQVVVMSEAIARHGLDELTRDQAQSNAALERAQAAVEAQRFDEAHAQLKVAMEAAVRVDGPVGVSAMNVHSCRGWALCQEGRFAEAGQANAAAAACSDVPPLRRAQCHLAAARLSRLVGQSFHAAGHARACLELAVDLFGAPGPVASFAAYELARAQLTDGALDEAKALSASLSAWAPALGSDVGVYAAWLEGLILAEQQDLAGAARSLREAVAAFTPDLAEPMASVSILLDLSEVVAKQGSDVIAVLEEAVAQAQVLGAADPERMRAEAELARRRGAAR